jgi:protein TonB
MKRLRRSRPLVVATLALLANLVLLLALAWAGAPGERRPLRPHDWTVREIFAAAPPPEPLPPEEPAEAPAPELPAPRDPLPAPSDPPAEPPSVRLELPLLAPSRPEPTAPRVHVGGGAPAAPIEASRVDRAPMRLSTPLPPYPAWARSQRLEGRVVLRFVVDEQGVVKDLQVDEVAGDARFAEAAREAVLGWRYEPGLIGGRKVPVRMQQTIRFQLVDR